MFIHSPSEALVVSRRNVSRLTTHFLLQTGLTPHVFLERYYFQACMSDFLKIVILYTKGPPILKGSEAIQIF